MDNNRIDNANFEQTENIFQLSINDNIFELMSNALSIGILGAYIDKLDNFPIFYMNDSLLKITGYDKKELFHMLSYDTFAIVHPLDKEYLLNEINQANENGMSEYHCQYRMIRKDDSVIWVIEHGKFSRRTNGRDFIFSAFTNITNTVTLQKTLEENAALLEGQAEELLTQNEELLNQRQVLEQQSDELLIQNDELIKQRNTFEEQAQSLVLSEERFRIALEKTSNVIFDYNVRTGKILLLNNTSQNLNITMSVDEVENKLINGATICDESMICINNSFIRINRGDDRSECITKSQLENGKIIYHRITMSSVKNNKGTCLRVIGLIEDITQQKEVENAYKQEEQYRKSMLIDVMALYSINYSKRVIENCQITSDDCVTIDENSDYDTSLEVIANNKLDLNDKQQFLEIFSRAKVLEAFESNQNEIKFDYVINDSQNKNIWVQAVLRLISDSITNDKKGFLYITNINDIKQKELDLIIKSESDPLTRLYNKSATQKHIKNILKEKESTMQGAFFMIDIDHFKKVNDMHGHPYGDEILCKIANALKESLRQDDIVGRVGGDEFCAFLNSISSRESIAKIAKVLCNKIYMINSKIGKRLGISCSIGISICDNSNKSFETIYKEADTALYSVKASGRNGFAFYGDEQYQDSNAWIQNTQWLLNEINMSFYICDSNNYNILYVNDYILQNLELSSPDCFGKKCYDLLFQRKTPCEFCSINNISDGKVITNTFTLPNSKIYMIKTQTINWNNNKSCLGIISDISEIYNDFVKE